MKKIAMLLLIFLFFLSASISRADDEEIEKLISHLSLPMPTGMKVPSDPELKNLVWHKLSTKNFTILSLDPKHGQYLQQNIEKMKQWVLARWGLPDIDFTAECRVLCVPDKKLMKKLFNLETSVAEVRKDKGKITLSVLWLVLDGNPAETVPTPLSVVCLNEFGQKYNFEMPLWAVRGMSYLNSTLFQIKTQLAAIDEYYKVNSQMYFSKALFSMTEEEWRKESVEKRLMFDREAVALCLLLRKEFGQRAFVEFLQAGPSIESNFSKTYGFKGFSEFDATLNRYMKHLSADVITNKTPNSYLQIQAAK